jgi:hypothetical protein
VRNLQAESVPAEKLQPMSHGNLPAEKLQPMSYGAFSDNKHHYVSCSGGYGKRPMRLASSRNG